MAIGSIKLLLDTAMASKILRFVVQSRSVAVKLYGVIHGVGMNEDDDATDIDRFVEYESRGTNNKASTTLPGTLVLLYLL